MPTERLPIKLRRKASPRFSMAEQGVPRTAHEPPCPLLLLSPEQTAGETVAPALRPALVTEPLPSNTRPVEVRHCPHLLGNADAESLEQQPQGYRGLFSFWHRNPQRRLVQADKHGQKQKFPRTYFKAPRFQ